MFPLDFLKTIGQGIGSGVKKVGQGIIPKSPDPLMRTPGFVPEGARAGGGILPQITRPEAVMPLRTPDIGGRGIVPTAPAIPRPATPPMLPPTQGIIPTAQQMPGQMPGAREVAPPMAMDRRDVMLPGLPGEAGPKEYSRMEAARYDYNRKRMKQPGEEGYTGEGQYKRSGKDIFRNLAMSFLQGAGSDRRNPLAAGLGGALVGGVGSAISPQGGAEYGFNTMERPRLEQQMADEDAELKRRNAQQRAELQQMLNAQRSRQLDADVELKRAQAEKARRVDLPKPQFHNVAPGAHVLNSEGKVIYQAPGNATTQAKLQGLMNTREGIYDPISRQMIERFDKPLSRTEALDEVYAEDGSLEQITEDSLAGRQAMLLEKLTPQERAYISKPPTDQDLGARLSPKQQAILSGVTDGATDAEVTQAYSAFEQLKQRGANEMAQARTKWEQIQNAERARIRRETEATARQKAAARRTGKAPAAKGGGGSVAPRNVNDLINLLPPIRN